MCKYSAVRLRSHVSKQEAPLVSEILRDCLEVLAANISHLVNGVTAQTMEVGPDAGHGGLEES